MPKACAAGKCSKIASGDLGGGYSVTVYTGPSPTGQVAADYLQLKLASVPVFWKITDGYHPGQLLCSARPAPNCAVEDAFGAHSSSGRVFLRQGNRLVQFGEALSDTPLTDIADLNGDGWIDVVAAVNTYEPDYATGKVYWSTSLSNGKRLVLSGCTVPRRNLLSKPTAPLTGTCPPS
jgi:hypothetical protein